MNAKRVLMGAGSLVFVAAVVAGGTGAFFSDTETSTGNVFTAGSVTLELTNIAHDYDGDDAGNPTQFNYDENAMNFSFADLKPLDSGEVTFDLTNGANEAFVCARVIDQGGADNGTNDPELDAGDTDANDDGELDQFLSFMFDGGVGTIADVDGQWTELATSPVAANTPTGASFSYCFGEFDGSNCVPGAGNTNMAQTDSLTADVEFYAVQTRNNEDFTCESLNVTVVQEDEFSGVDLSDEGMSWFAKVRNNNGGFELAVGSEDDTTPGQDTAEATWTEDTDYNFTLTYDAGTGEATWEVDGEDTTQFTVGPDTFSNLGITAKAPADETTTVSNLALDIYPSLSPTSFAANGGTESLTVSGLDLDQDWVLTGTFNFTGLGTGTGFSQENPAVQISVN